MFICWGLPIERLLAPLWNISTEIGLGGVVAAFGQWCPSYNVLLLTFRVYKFMIFILIQEKRWTSPRTIRPRYLVLVFYIHRHTIVLIEAENKVKRIITSQQKCVYSSSSYLTYISHTASKKLHLHPNVSTKLKFEVSEMMYRHKRNI